MNNVVQDGELAPPQVKDHAKLYQAVGCYAYLRDSLHLQAEALAEEFARRRDEMGRGFANLNLQTQRRNKGRTISLYWGLLHFRNGKTTGFTLIKRSKNALHFDVTAIETNAPEWLRPIARDIELRARPIREALVEITDIERRMRVIANRLKLGDIYEPTQSDENDLSLALPGGYAGGTPESDFLDERL